MQTINTMFYTPFFHLCEREKKFKNNKSNYPQMIQMLQQMGQDVPASKPTLEVNPDHPLIKKLESSEQSDTDFDKLAQVIFDQALLADGGQLDDPAAYLKRVNELLMR